MSTSADVRTDATASSTATCHHHHRQGMYQHWGSKWMVLAKFSMRIGYENLVLERVRVDSECP